MPKSRRLLERYIQVDVPPMIKKLLRTAAANSHAGNMSEYVRKLVYRGLMDDGYLTPEQLAMCLAGLDLSDMPKANGTAPNGATLVEA